jgi:hypothetical protein
MAVVIFSGAVSGQTMRVVDMGAGQTPRVVVEVQMVADAMGGRGWGPVDPIPGATLGALLLAAHVIT